MMTFETVGNTSIATNSIKPAMIHKTVKGYMLYTPEGRLLDSFESAGPFETFEKAKRNAETNVGVNMVLEDL